MATPLDISTLKHFEGVFPFLFVLVALYAFLSNTDMFRERKGLAALIAVLAAFMTLFSGVAMKTVNLMAPWFVLMVIFMLLFMLAFMATGIGGDTIKNFITEGKGGVGTWIMAIMLIIGIGSLLTAINEESSIETLQAGGEVSEPQELGFWQTIFHPKILGMALLLLVGFFTVQRLTEK